MDAPEQHSVLAESPATNPIPCGCTQYKVQRSLACINRAPLRALPRQLQGALQHLPHRVLLRATALEDLFGQDSVVGSGGFGSG
jgi:hypothetical protein